MVVTEPDTGVETYRAELEGEDVLWTDTLELAYGAWSFNADCTQCVTVQLPRTAVWCRVFYPHPGGYWAESPDEQPTYPQVDAHRIEVAISHDESGAEATMTQTLAPNLVAEEDGAALTIASGSGSRVDATLDGFSVALADGSTAAGDRWYTTRILVHAHLPA